ncbi:putative Restriction endonuclease S subunit [metagenome]
MQVSKSKDGYKRVKVGIGKYEEIPETWECVKLSSLCIRSGQYGANVSAKNEDVKLPRYIRITDINPDGSLKKRIKSIDKEHAEKYLLEDGDILFARSGSVGRTYLYDKKDGVCAFAGYLIRFVPNSSFLNPKYLFYFTHSSYYYNWLRKNYTQVTIQNINAKQYSNLNIILPTISEQKKIASIISNVDNTLQKTNQIIEKMELLKKEMMLKLLTKGINHSKFKKVDWYYKKQIEIPKEWELKTLNELSELFVPMRNKPKNLNGSIPWIRIEDFEGKYVSGSKSNQGVDNKTISDMHLKVYPIGTVLCACSGMSIGNYAITTSPLISNQTFIGISPNSKLDSEYLYYYMNTQTRNLKNISTGTTLPYISREKFETLKIPVPPIIEQKRISSIFIDFDLQIQKEKIHKNNIELLKKGLIEKLLTGQIRVKI